MAWRIITRVNEDKGWTMSRERRNRSTKDGKVVVLDLFIVRVTKALVLDVAIRFKALEPTLRESEEEKLDKGFYSNAPPPQCNRKDGLWISCWCEEKVFSHTHNQN